VRRSISMEGLHTLKGALDSNIWVLTLYPLPATLVVWCWIFFFVFFCCWSIKVLVCPLGFEI
jgi:hypothetical protein